MLKTYTTTAKSLSEGFASNLFSCIKLNPYLQLPDVGIHSLVILGKLEPLEGFQVVPFLYGITSPLTSTLMIINWKALSRSFFNLN